MFGGTNAACPRISNGSMAALTDWQFRHFCAHPLQVRTCIYCSSDSSEPPMQQLLLEYQMVFRGNLRTIFPILFFKFEGEVHGDFFNGGGMPTYQDGMVQAIEDKLSGHLCRLEYANHQSSQILIPRFECIDPQSRVLNYFL